MHLLSLPFEVLDLILSEVLATRWEWDFTTKQSDVLVVCKLFHHLGRKHLYRTVTLSTLEGFHNYFLVDCADWEEVNAQLVGWVRDDIEMWDDTEIALELPDDSTIGARAIQSLTRWRDRPASVARRKADWSNVHIHMSFALLWQAKRAISGQHKFMLTNPALVSSHMTLHQARELVVDLNFTPCFSHPVRRAMPYTVNSLGDPVTLEQPSVGSSSRLLPNLELLIERSSNEYEDYEIYRLQTMFRFTFYGSFSPRQFSLPLGPSPGDRLLMSRLQRFPTTLLSKTKVVYIRDLIDFDEMFPLYPSVTQDGLARGRNDQHNHSQVLPWHAAPPAVYLTPVSETVTTVVCLNEDFGYQLEPYEFRPYLCGGVSKLLLQFPNLKRLHLPDEDSFFMYTSTARKTELVRAYRDAIMDLQYHDDPEMKALEVVTDQGVYIPDCSL